LKFKKVFYSATKEMFSKNFCWENQMLNNRKQIKMV